MVESLRLHMQLFSKVKHPLHEDLTVRKVESRSVVLRAKEFRVFNKLFQDYIHRHFRSELLFSVTDALTDVALKRLKVAAVRTVAHLGVGSIGQEGPLVRGIALRALERNIDCLLAVLQGFAAIAGGWPLDGPVRGTRQAA